MMCVHIFKKGPRTGENCKRVVRKEGRLRCAIHEKNGPLKERLKEDVIIKDNENEEDEVAVDRVDLISSKIEFVPFDLGVEPLKNGNSTCIFGASQSGKTTLLRHIIEEFYSSKKLLCFVFAENINVPIYKQIRKSCIHTDKYRPSIIKGVHKIQRQNKLKYPSVFILDDIVTEKKDETIMKLFLTYRNQRISSIGLFQNVVLLDKRNRTNVNRYIFKFFGSNESVIQILEYIKGYAPFFGLSTIEQINLYKKITIDLRNFIMLDMFNDKLTFHSIDLK